MRTREQMLRSAQIAVEMVENGRQVEHLEGLTYTLARDLLDLLAKPATSPEEPSA